MSESGDTNIVGIILSGGTTSEATAQLTEHGEMGGIKEGMLVFIRDRSRENRYILARVSEIVPYNYFYLEGDPFSDVRRKGRDVPDVARKYEVCKLELLMELNDGIRSEVRIPPHPGDYVEKINPGEYSDLIFGIDRSRGGYIFLGTLAGYENDPRNIIPIPLDINKIPMHLAIFGVTGSGKSFTTGVLIEKLSNMDIGRDTIAHYPIILVDAHGDYLEYSRDTNWRQGRIVERYVFPNSPVVSEVGSEFTIGIDLDEMADLNKPHMFRLLAEMIITFYKGTTEGSEIQVHMLQRFLEWLKINHLGNLNNLFSEDTKNIVNMFNDFQKDESIHPQTKSAIERALERFRELEENHSLFSNHHSRMMNMRRFIDDVTRNQKLIIIDFSDEGAPGVDLPTKQLVISYLATMLFDIFTDYKARNEQRYLLFVMEEAQNFCPDKRYPIGASIAKDILSAIATQGRKFGLSLCLISQRPVFVDRIVLSMCNTFIIHRISPEDVEYVKSITGGLPSGMARKLTVLETGYAIVTGQMLPTPFPLMIKILENDRSVPHGAGETNVLDALRRERDR